jgi:SMODS and SLOG-associating 2TM effector domain 3/SMODS and SLOG-associating 2TM effector domain 1
MTTRQPQFTWHDLAPFFKDADAAAIAAQRRYLGQVRAQLVLLVTAAAAGITTWRINGRSADWSGVVAAVAFLAALVLRLYTEQQRDDKKWYDSRAAAESSKTLCWRYAVCGSPFPEALGVDAARDLFLRRLGDISSGLEHMTVIATTGDGGEITPAMAACRRSTRTDRIHTYRANRLEEQLTWYATAATKNEDRSRLWLKLALAAETLGLSAGILRAATVITVDLLGVASALAASAGAWLQVKQHNTLASAYSVTAREIRRVLSLVDLDADAAEWADFVDHAEEAISREHTLWVASRAGRLFYTFREPE